MSSSDSSHSSPPSTRKPAATTPSSSKRGSYHYNSDSSSDLSSLLGNGGNKAPTSPRDELPPPHNQTSAPQTSTPQPTSTSKPLNAVKSSKMPPPVASPQHDPASSPLTGESSDEDANEGTPLKSSKKPSKKKEKQYEVRVDSDSDSSAFSNPPPVSSTPRSPKAFPSAVTHASDSDSDSAEIPSSAPSTLAPTPPSFEDVGTRRAAFSTASMPTSERTIDQFLSSLPTAGSPAPSSGLPSPKPTPTAGMSRTSSLRSVTTGVSATTDHSKYRTPTFSSPNSTTTTDHNKSLELTDLNVTSPTTYPPKMTDVPLTSPDPKTPATLAVSQNTVNTNTSKDARKVRKWGERGANTLCIYPCSHLCAPCSHLYFLSQRVFRRPYAKTNELGWRQSHYIRKWAIIATDSTAWEVTVLLLIVANCVTLSMSSPLDDPDSAKTKTLSVIEMIFSVSFTIELIAKIVAMGYYTDPTAYMRDAWNILDFLIVTLGWFSEIAGGGGGLTSFRAMRVLRPLRTIKGIPELKRIIESMIAALPQLSTVFGLCAACYLLFGILGMQLFGGKMSQRCMDDATSEYDFDSGRLCSLSSSFGRQCDVGFTCGNSGESINDGITNFDNVFLAFLAVFQSCTLEGWVDMMYALMDTMPASVPGIYFVVLIWIGSLFLLNLVTVVVYISYSQSADQIKELTEGPTDKEELAHEIETATMVGLLAVQQNVKVMALQAVDDLNKAILTDTAITSFTDSPTTGLRHRNETDLTDATDFSSPLPPPPAHAVITEDMVEAKKHTQAIEMSKVASLLFTAVQQLKSIPNVHVHGPNSHPSDHDASQKIKFVPPVYDVSPGAFVCYAIISNKWFNGFMNFCIVANTVCLAIDGYGISAPLSAFLKTSNIYFTIIFTFEIYTKIKGLGMNEFGKDGFNAFDSIIVLISLIELLVTPDRGGGISALRSFRIMRLFKLLRSWKTLRRILKNMAMTMSSSSSFVGLLCLIIFVFSLVGMTMYGGTLPYECEDNYLGEEVCYAPRANYDSLFTSAVVSYQIMTMENWNEVLYLLIDANGYFASFFIILNLLIGGFLMMNIFLAILIDNYTMAVLQEAKKARLKEEHHKERERVRGILQNTPGSSLYGTNNTPLGGLDPDSMSDMSDEDAGSDDGDDPKPAVDVDVDCQKLFDDPTLHPAYEYDSFCIFRSGGRLRHLIFKFVLWPRFDQFILTLIILNCVTLAINEPGANGEGPTGSFGDTIDVFDAIFTYSFIVEFVLKLLAFGLLLHPGSYMRNNWNLLDGLIVITSIIELANASEGEDGGNMSRYVYNVTYPPPPTCQC